MLNWACVVYSSSETILTMAVGVEQQLIIVIVLGLIDAHLKLLGFNSMRGRLIIRYISSVSRYKHRRTTHVLT